MVIPVSSGTFGGGLAIANYATVDDVGEVGDFSDPVDLCRIDRDAGEFAVLRGLWLAVILEAKNVVRRGLVADVSVAELGRSRSWFRSPDFHTVCALAGVDGYAVRKRVNLELAQLGKELV